MQQCPVRKLHSAFSETFFAKRASRSDWFQTSKKLSYLAYHFTQKLTTHCCKNVFL